jgi:hypothetical protein
MLARFARAALVSAVTLVANRSAAQSPPAPAVPPAAEPPVVVPPRPEPITFDIGVRVGGAVRIGDSPTLPIATRSGAMFGVALAIAPSPKYAIGLAYEHTDIGSEHGEGDVGILDVSRSLDSLWASVRLSLFRNDRVSLGIAIGPGLVWQHVDTSAIILSSDTAGLPSTFQCTETGGPGLGLRANVGAEITLGGGFYLNLDAVIDELRLSGDLLGTCAPGAGSTAVFGARGGFAYRFDVSHIMR